MILFSPNRLHYCNLGHCPHYVVFMFCKFIFLSFLSYLFFGKIWVGKVEFSTWKLVQKVSWGCDYKDTVEGLETKMYNFIKCFLLLYFYCSQKYRLEQPRKCWVNGIIAAIRIFLIKKFYFNQILKQDQDSI